MLVGIIPGPEVFFRLDSHVLSLILLSLLDSVTKGEITAPLPKGEPRVYLLLGSF